MKYKIKLRTITPLILSNRMNDALYKGVDFSKENEEKDFSDLASTNIIYQFSCYEDRSLRTDKSFSYAKNYYIPASSIKGALCLKEEHRTLKFKDMIVAKDVISLKYLYKFQYLYQNSEYLDKRKTNKDAKPKKIKHKKYFPNILVEMMNPGECIRGEIIVKNNDKMDCKDILDNVNSISQRKLRAYLKQIGIICNMDYFKKLEEINVEEDSAITEFKKLKSNIDNLLKKDITIAFLGSFKGLLGGLTNFDFKDDKEIQNGFYIDKDTMLPYGLVEIDIKESVDEHTKN